METQLQRLAGRLTAGLLIALAQCVRGNVPSHTLSLLLPQTGVQSVNPEVTLISGSEVYLSAQPGAKNTGALIWSAAAAGTFSIRLSADCASGTMLASGFVGTSGVYWSSTASQTYSPIVNQLALNTTDGSTSSSARGGPMLAVRCVKGP